jgi:hypothetical protein
MLTAPFFVKGIFINTGGSFFFFFFGVLGGGLEARV